VVEVLLEGVSRGTVVEAHPVKRRLPRVRTSAKIRNDFIGVK
jgi:hypothetical protein